MYLYLLILKGTVWRFCRKIVIFQVIRMIILFINERKSLFYWIAVLCRPVVTCQVMKEKTSNNIHRFVKLIWPPNHLIPFGLYFSIERIYNQMELQFVILESNNFLSLYNRISKKTISLYLAFLYVAFVHGNITYINTEENRYREYI